MLYHYLTGLPPVKLPNGFIPRYTAHAMQAAQNDKRGYIQLPDYINCQQGCKIIEVETQGNRVVKIVTRHEYNNSCDLVIVWMNDGTVKTVWLNDKLDNHSTINLARYTPYQKGR